MSENDPKPGVDTNKVLEWWEKVKIPNYNEGGHLDANWAELAMCFGESMKGGRVTFSRSIDGYLKKEFQEGFKSEFEQLIAADGGRLVYNNAWGKELVNNSYVYLLNNGMCTLRTESTYVDISVRHFNKDFAESIYHFVKPKLGSKVSQGKVFVIVSDANGPSLTSIGIAAVDFERDNYNTSVVEGMDFVIDELKSASPAGRVAILDGEPGTGKTFLIRSLLKEVPEAIFIMVPSSALEALSGPSLVPLLVRTKRDSSVPIIFILEDADGALVPRASDNIGAISTLLNFSDGILGSLLDIRIIATTNAKITEIDKAILRPGRLSRRIDVSRLSPEHAARRFEALAGKPPSTPMTEKKGYTLAEIYSMARNDGYVPPVAPKKVGFNNDYSNAYSDDEF